MTRLLTNWRLLNIGLLSLTACGRKFPHILQCDHWVWLLMSVITNYPGNVWLVSFRTRSRRGQGQRWLEGAIESVGALSQTFILITSYFFLNLLFFAIVTNRLTWRNQKLSVEQKFLSSVLGRGCLIEWYNIPRQFRGFGTFWLLPTSSCSVHPNTDRKSVV